jgi:hypothetical protein
MEPGAPTDPLIQIEHEAWRARVLADELQERLAHSDDTTARVMARNLASALRRIWSLTNDPTVPITPGSSGAS